TGSDGNTYEVELSGEEDTWTADVEVQKYWNHGEEVTFEVDEEEVAEYEKEIDNENLTITNSYEPETDTIVVTKVWNDNEDQDGIRPDSVKFTVTGSDGNVYEVELGGEAVQTQVEIEVQKYFNHGEEVTFEVDEEDVPGYEKTIDNENLTIFNYHEVEQITITVTKVWEDENDIDEFRPESIEITLSANGEEVETVELNEGNEWTYSWTVDKYEAGEEITYTLDEANVPDGYSKTVGEMTGDAENGFKVEVTNTHEPIPPVTDDPPVMKIVDCVDGNKPANDDEFTFVFKPVSAPEGMEVSDMPLPVDEKGNIRTSVTIKAGVQFEFGTITFDKEGTYVYEISEENTGLENYTYDETVYTVTYNITKTLEGYQKERIVSVDGEVVNMAVFTFTNVYTEPKIEINVSKVWKDKDNKEGYRPDSITVKLFADGKDTGLTATLSDENEWKYTFTELNAKLDNKEIEYTVEEVKVEKYNTKITGDAKTGFVITNTLEDTPPTGDDTPIGMWAGIMVMAMLGFGLVCMEANSEKKRRA
ncbi:MAG: Cna B-type domain-containing protein, partial [Firmicutes bacterium]|nr:Cna B-type domain-containing protein [Bacillota bacterium]